MREYLEERRVHGLKWNEKSLRDDLSNFCGGAEVQRGVAQHLRKILLKTRNVSKVLESEVHEKFLDQRRSFTPLQPEPVQPVQSKAVQSKPVQSRSVLSKPMHSSAVQVRTSRPLGYHGKRYRIRRLKDEMEQDFNLIVGNGKKGKLDAFKVLNYQQEANMSRRGIAKTNKLVKHQTGFNVLPGDRLLQRAREATYPEEILSDDFNVEVSLQNGVNKTVERLIQSDERMKELIKEKREITFVLKTGQDGSSGFAQNNKRTNRGTSKQQIAFVPLALEATNGGETIWRNPKPNSRRRTRILKSKWAKESTEHILETFANIEDQIKNLHNKKFVLDNIEVNITFKVFNVMNDGKVMTTISSEYFKEKGIIAKSAKSLSTQTCHLCGLNTSNFSHKFKCKQAIPDLKRIGFAPMHASKNSRECLLITLITIDYY